MSFQNATRKGNYASGCYLQKLGHTLQLVAPYIIE